VGRHPLPGHQDLGQGKPRVEIVKHWSTGVSAVCRSGAAEQTFRFPCFASPLVIERTFAWISRNRRLAKDYENLPESGEAFIYMAMSRILLKRLARDSSISDISKA